MVNKTIANIDLWKDAADMYNNVLMSWGYTDQRNCDPDELCLKFLNAENRRIQPVPRNIHVSKAVVVPSALQAGYDMLLDKVLKGEDLSPNLSARLRKVNYHDGLLNAWRIYHFHLGATTYPDGLVVRTGEVLFAMVTDEDFYAIHIEEHDETANPEAFYNQAMIEILHNSWPAMMSRYRVKGVIAVEQKASNADQKLLRQNGINAFVETSDGTLYTPPGLGVTSQTTDPTKKYGVLVVHEMHLLKQTVKRFEKTILEKLPHLELAFGKTGGQRPYEFKLQWLSREDVVALEKSSGVELAFCWLPGKNGNEPGLIIRHLDKAAIGS